MYIYIYIHTYLHIYIHTHKFIVDGMECEYAKQHVMSVTFLNLHGRRARTENGIFYSEPVVCKRTEHVKQDVYVTSADLVWSPPFCFKKSLPWHNISNITYKQAAWH